MTYLKLKLKKCAFKKCRAEFQPMTEWQKYCSPRHRSAEGNRQRAELVKKAQRMIAEEERGAA